MKILGLIPARYGSTRFPGKPLHPIAGKPLIAHVVERCRQAASLDEVIVATDDERIREAVYRFGGNAVMTSSTCRSGTDRVAEAAQGLGLEKTDIVVNIQGDQPLVDPRCFDTVVRPFYEDRNVKMSTLAYAITEERELTDPKDVKVTFDNNGDALYFSRATIPYDRDGKKKHTTYKHLGVYAYTRDFLDCFRSLSPGKLEEIEKLEQLRALEHGYRIRVMTTPFDSPEVDVPEDIQRIEKKIEAFGIKE